MQKHLPGSRIIVRNVPGAGHIVGANTLYAARPDGLTIGSFNTGLIYDQLMQREGVPLQQFEPDWLGARVTQPTLVIHDEADRVAPFSAGRRMAMALPHARLHPTQGLGHTRALGDRAVAMAVLRHCLDTSGQTW